MGAKSRPLMGAGAGRRGLAVAGTLVQLLICWSGPCHGHGRLLEPPARNTLWRFGFKAPANYNDNELFCGGIGAVTRNKGKCGLCGDPYDGPRLHETGNSMAQNQTARNYFPGSTIDLMIEIVANHGGHFSFDMCWRNSWEERETEACFEPLRLSSSSVAASIFQKNRTQRRQYRRRRNSNNKNDDNNDDEAGAGAQVPPRPPTSAHAGGEPPPQMMTTSAAAAAAVPATPAKAPTDGPADGLGPPPLESDNDGFSYELDPSMGTGTVSLSLELPAGRECERCVLRWHWRAANNWGRCPDNSERVGCGFQEVWRNCADLSVSRSGQGIGLGLRRRRRSAA